MIRAIPKWLAVKMPSLLMMSSLTTRLVENLVVVGAGVLHIMERVMGLDRIEETSKIKIKVKLN